MTMNKKLLLIIILILTFFNCYTKEYNTIRIPIWKNKVNTFSFSNNEFIVSLNFNDWTLNPVLLNKTKEIYFKLENNAELLEITEIDNNTYVFFFSALGFEQFFIYDVKKDHVSELFFDLKKDVSIRVKDFNNLVLFGDTWNSDKGITADQTITLYLFSTSKKQHLKIAEKRGSGFNVKLISDCKIEYIDQNEKLVQFDYSDWIIQTISYDASSFLVEGKTIYGPVNLSSVEGLPWASKNGYGLNDNITIAYSGYTFSQLTLYNGFQSATRPDLYRANSRVKKIRITNLQSGEAKEVVVKDISKPQYISLLDLNLSKQSKANLVITVLEVYPGDKYEDLCIQALIPVY